MVELAEIQFAYYMLAATGVLVAAIYYIISLRYNMKAREMEICRLVTSDFASEQGMQRYATIMNIEWKNYEDFIEKYGYSNPEIFGKWTSQFFVWNTQGILIKNKVVTAEKLYSTGGFGAIRAWEKYKDIIQSRRDVAWGPRFFCQRRVLRQGDAEDKDKKRC